MNRESFVHLKLRPEKGNFDSPKDHSCVTRSHAFEIFWTGSRQLNPDTGESGDSGRRMGRWSVFVIV